MINDIYIEYYTPLHSVLLFTTTTNPIRRTPLGLR